jgi:hypothetical protein
MNMKCPANRSKPDIIELCASGRLIGLRSASLLLYVRNSNPSGLKAGKTLKNWKNLYNYNTVAIQWYCGCLTSSRTTSKQIILFRIEL